MCTATRLWSPPPQLYPVMELLTIPARVTHTGLFPSSDTCPWPSSGKPSTVYANRFSCFEDPYKEQTKAMGTDKRYILHTTWGARES